MASTTSFPSKIVRSRDRRLCASILRIEVSERTVHGMTVKIHTDMALYTWITREAEMLVHLQGIGVMRGRVSQCLDDGSLTDYVRVYVRFFAVSVRQRSRAPKPDHVAFIAHGRRLHTFPLCRSW